MRSAELKVQSANFCILHFAFYILPFLIKSHLKYLSLFLRPHSAGFVDLPDFGRLHPFGGYQVPCWGNA